MCVVLTTYVRSVPTSSSLALPGALFTAETQRLVVPAPRGKELGPKRHILEIAFRNGEH